VFQSRFAVSGGSIASVSLRNRRSSASSGGVDSRRAEAQQRTSSAGCGSGAAMRALAPWKRRGSDQRCSLMFDVARQQL
jgi:hypothetical protein